MALRSSAATREARLSTVIYHVFLLRPPRPGLFSARRELFRRAERLVDGFYFRLIAQVIDVIRMVEGVTAPRSFDKHRAANG